MMDYCARFAWTGDPNRRADAGGDEGGAEQAGTRGALPRWEPWSNEPNEPKLIHLDAGRKEARIAMAHDEMTLARVKAFFDAAPETTQATLRDTQFIRLTESGGTALSSR